MEAYGFISGVVVGALGVVAAISVIGLIVARIPPSPLLLPTPQPTPWPNDTAELHPSDLEESPARKRLLKEGPM